MTYQAFIPEVVAAFGLDVVTVGSAQKGYRNESYKLTLDSGEYVNLIFHKNEREAHNRIASADKASLVLDDASMPVRTRFDKRTLKLSDGKKEVYTGIYSYLPGTTIPWEAYTKDHIKLLGWAMSDMHDTWRQSSIKIPARIDDELEELCGRMDRYFCSQDVRLAMENKLHVLLALDCGRYKKLLKRLRFVPQTDEHILHMDLVRGNALFSQGANSPWSMNSLALSGVIDFEKVAIGHPVYDIARTLAFLLVDCENKDRQSIFKYFLQSGYNKRGRSLFQQSDKISGMEASQVLNMLIGFFLLHDFYKFLRHTPYESLEANHHYVRTRNILVDYGMIRLIKTEITTRG